MKSKILSAAFMLLLLSAQAQLSPAITSWVINTDSATGYAGILSNVQLVQYSDSSVYISATCIPAYDIGPWHGDPSIPANQNFVYKLTRFPVQNMDSPVVVGLGHVGVWSNGVSIFNPLDAHSYDSLNVWHQNAYYFEEPSFDACLGHPQMNGEYHHHINPRCLYNDADSTHHSPIIGFAFDGFPVYGAYGYANSNSAASGIKRMNSSYQLRTITSRTSLPNGDTLSPTLYGPSLSTYSLGHYQEDFIYVPNSGDLDFHNGRYCVTPDYPNGTYAYFVTIDSTLTPVYPYIFGLTYYGTIAQGALGPGSGHAMITESTTIYHPDTTTGTNTINKSIKFQLAPNPVKDYTYIYFDPASDNNITGTLYNNKGQLLRTINNMQPSISYALDMTKYSSGTYFLHLETKNTAVVQKVVKVK